MNEVKRPKKPLIYYYVIAMLILLLVNLLLTPWLLEQQIQEVDYGTFMTMTEEGNIGQVEIQEDENQIVFTDKDNRTIYKTGMVEDADLTKRLYESGASFSGQIVEQMSPILSFLISWVLPIAIFIGIGEYMSRKLMKRAGGANSMAFGMGKSSAKVYVKSSEGIRFSPCPVQNLWKCSSAWAQQKSGICSNRLRKKHHVSYSSMRSMPLVKSGRAISAAMTSGSRR